ncbi:MAG: flippase [Bacteroidota bacterium]
MAKSYWIESGFFTLMERFSMQLFALISVMILFRALTKAEVGQWAAFLSIVTIVEVGRTGLLQNALIKFLSTANEERYKTLATSSFLLNLIVTFCLVVPLFFGAEAISEVVRVPELKLLLQLHCLTTIALVPFLQFNFMQQASLEFRGIFWATFVRQGSYFLYVALFFLLNYKIELTNLVIVRTVGVVLGAIVSYFFARPFLRFSRAVNWKTVWKLFHYGKFVMGTNLSTMFYKGTDRLMIARMLGEIPVGIYDAALKVTNLAEAPTFSMASILFPQSARRMEEGKEAIKLLYEKAVGAILAILVPAIVMVLIFAEWIIWIIAGEDFLDASNILRLTMFYGIFIPFAVQFGTVLDSTGRPKINFAFTVVSALLNIIFNYFFIRQFGIIGAAYGTLTTYFLSFIGMQMYLHRIFGVSFWKAFRYAIEFYGRIWRLIRQKVKL